MLPLLMNMGFAGGSGSAIIVPKQLSTLLILGACVCGVMCGF